VTLLNNRRIDRLAYVVPCYNEQDCLMEFYRRVCAIGDRHPELTLEMVFVNDGSQDRTAEILDSLADKDPRVKALHLAWNSGHQKALCAGLDHVEADLIIVLDADLQDPPELLDEILAKAKEGFDIIHMQRRRRAGEPWFKLFTAWLFYWLIRNFGNRKLIPNCGDFRAITKPVLHVIRYCREPHKYYRGLFATMGFRQTIVRYDRDARFAGDTKYPFRKMLTFALDAILNFSTLPLRLVITSAIAVWAFSLLYLVYALIEIFGFGRGVRGWSSIVVLMAAFTGLILSCLAIMGAYIRRIFEQGQNRPQYFVYSAKNIVFQDINEERKHIREYRLSAETLSDNQPNRAVGDTNT
jgi:polyisoprenyl-phosphate glycosyltransferase